MNTHLSFDQRVEKSAEVFESYFSDWGKDDAVKHVWERLSELGIKKDNKKSYNLIDEGFCKEGDARVAFCESDSVLFNLPVPWFRKLWSVLAPSTAVTETVTKHEGTTSAIVQALADQRPIAQWKDDKLLDEYGIDCSSDVIDELNKRSKGCAIIVFDDNGGVNKDVTRMLLSRVRRNMSLPKDIYNDNGTVRRLWNVGEFPNDVEEESPFVRGVTLINGMCTEYNVDLSDVSMEAKQFIRIIVNEGKAPSQNDRVALKGLVAAAKSGVEELKDLYPKVWVKFNDLKRTDQLPSLKVVNSETSGSSKKDPFGGNERS